MPTSRLPRRLALATTLALALSGQALASCEDRNAVALPTGPDELWPRVWGGTTRFNDNPNGCTLYHTTVEPGGKIVNRARLTVPLYTEPYGNPVWNSLLVRGSLINEGGNQLDNDGHIRLGDDWPYGNAELFSNQGNLDNRGRITMTGWGGSFVNSGSILNREGAFIEVRDPYGLASLQLAGGIIRNDGTLRLPDLILGSPDTRGTLLLRASGTLENTPVTIEGGFTQRNEGRWINNRSLWIYGGLINTGTLASTSDLLVIGGTLYNDTTGTLTLGTAGSSGASITSALRSNGQVVNLGVLTVHRDAKLQIGADAPPGLIEGHLQNDGELQIHGTLENWHTVHNTGSLRVTGALHNHGEVWNQAGGTLTNRGNIISDGRITNDGDFENAGFIQITAGDLVVNGELRSTGNGALLVAAGANIVGGGRYVQESGRLVLDGVMNLGGGFGLDGGELCGHGSILHNVTGGAAHICSVVGAGTPTVSRALRTLASTADAPEEAVLSIAGDFYLLDGGSLTFDVSGSGPGSFTRLALSGRLVVMGTGSLHLNFANGYRPTVGTQWTLLSAANPEALNTLDFVVQGLPQGYAFARDSQGGFGVTSAPIPEPASAWLLLLGLLAIAGLRRTREDA